MMASPLRSALGPSINFQLELPIGPVWQNVDLLRLAILNCLAAVFGDQDLSESVGIVTSELLENAIKYGDWTRKDHPYLTLSVRGNGEEVRVEVASPVATSSKHYENVQKMVAWIQKFGTAREAYIARMHAIADQEDATGESRMGLVRIAYEGPCAIEVMLEHPEMLRIRALIPTVNRVV
jgi:hypothetical protein